MAATHTLTGNIFDLARVPLGDQSVRVFVVTNLDDSEALVDKTTNGIHLGGKPADIDSVSGEFTIDLIDTAATDLNVLANTLEYETRAVFIDQATGVQNSWRSGWFPLTADRNLADIATDVSPMAVQSASAFALEAKAFRDQAAEISGLTSVEAALATADSNPSSPFRVAQDARFAAKAATEVAASVATTAYSGAYAGWVPSLDPQRVVVIGDSIENLRSFNVATARTFGWDWPTYAAAFSGGRFNLVYNAGVGGQTTTQYLARFDADVNPQAPTMVVIGAGENDAQNSFTLATYSSNIQAMVTKTLALGAVPVLRTTAPHDIVAAATPRIKEYNTWLRQYAAERRYPLLDYWAQVVDPLTDKHRAGFSYDGVHPNQFGARMIGRYVVETLWPGATAFALPLHGDVEATTNLVNTPGWATDVSGTPTGWNAIGGSPTGVTRTMVKDQLVQGRMARIAMNGSTSSVSIFTSGSDLTPASDGLAAGDTIEMTGCVTSDGGIRVSVTLAVTGSSGTFNYAVFSALKAPLLRATYKVRAALPSGFTGAQVQLTAGQAGAGAGVGDGAPIGGTGYVDFSCPLLKKV